MIHAPQVKAFLHPDTSTFSYVVWDASSRTAAVIDAVLHYEAASGRTSTRHVDDIVAFVHEQSLTVQWVLETHAHADHVAGGAHIQRALGGTTGIGAGICTVQEHFAGVFDLGATFTADGSQFDHLFGDDEAYQVGDIPARTIATPGHTPDHLTHLIGDAAFVGDTLFMPDGGTARCDFPGGDAATLHRSIQRLFELPDATRVFVLHDYRPDGREYRNATTIGAQKRDNIHVGGGRSEAEFVALRNARDRTLAMPRLIIPAIQINIRGGYLPAADDNGTRYLKIPLNRADAFSTCATAKPEMP